MKISKNVVVFENIGEYPIGVIDGISVGSEIWYKPSVSLTEFLGLNNFFPSSEKLTIKNALNGRYFTLEQSGPEKKKNLLASFYESDGTYYNYIASSGSWLGTWEVLNYPAAEHELRENNGFWAWSLQEQSYYYVLSNKTGDVSKFQEIIPDSYSITKEYQCKVDHTTNKFITWFLADGTKPEEDPGGNSGEGGGSGTFDNTSDPVDFPSLPTLSAVSAGFVSLYAPTLSQMNNLSNYMWSDAFDINNFKKLFADPMDVVIGLSIVPVSVPKGTDKEIKIGLVSTGVTMTQAASQYVTVDCGTIDVKEYWGSALDYSPYTKFSIYLPYIGTRDIKTDDIMGKAVQVKYNIDILSGSCTAMIKCGDSVLYEYSGSCASSIPLTGNNWTSLVTAGIQLAGMGIAAAATGGAAAAAAAPTAATMGKAAGSAATYAAGNVSSMKPTVQRSGGVSGSAGMLGIQRPYLIAELPRQSLAKNYKSFVGYPSNITKKLSELTGYTEIEDVHLEDIPATTSELEEIHNLLVNGVIM